jgi:hypothetical protein
VDAGRGDSCEERVMVKRLVFSLVGLTMVAVAATWGAYGQAGASTVRYSRTWSPPLNLASNYRPCCKSSAGFTTLPFTMNVKGTQEAVLTVLMHTNWVDTKALTYTPNIIQQGRYVKQTEIKISIHSGPNPSDHRAQCRITGAGGKVANAQGPAGVDVADGFWHKITCTKFADGSNGTDVQVVVDGVAGPMTHSRTPIGDVISNAAVDLGGQGPVANKDSIDGRYSFVSYTVS